MHSKTPNNTNNIATISTVEVPIDENEGGNVEWLMGKVRHLSVLNTHRSFHLESEFA